MSSTTSLIRQAQSALRNGDLDEAERVSRKVLKHDPGAVDARRILGDALTLRGNELREHGQLDAAIGVYSEAAEHLDNHIGVLNNLAVAQHESGRYSAARDTLTRILERQPDWTDGHCNIGRLHLDLGDPLAAHASLTRALELNPYHVEAMNNLGLALIDLGDPARARNVLMQALQLRPGNAAITLSLARAHLANEEVGPARTMCERVLAAEPGHAGALSQLAQCALREGRGNEAEALLREALDRAPGNGIVRNRLAAYLEAIHRLDDALKIAMPGLELERAPTVLFLTAARCLRRKGDVGAARGVIDRCPGGSALPSVQFERGRIADVDGDVEAAFKAYSAGNSTMAARWGKVHPGPNAWRGMVEAIEDTLDEDFVRGWSGARVPEGHPVPAFLVGFPRSGTTLLDQILDAHPDIRVAEERPLFDKVREAIDTRHGGYPAGLAALDASDLHALRAEYWSHAPDDVLAGGMLLVDKLPLNMVHAAAISRVFSGARFIFMLRHPCDAVLSCFMQEFAQTSAMANFHTLEDAAATYDLTMRLWVKQTELLPLEVHTLRYEDLLEDFESQVRALLEFLGPGWDDAVRDHVAHTHSRGRINTPSYHQVSRPIYTDARYRWERYRTHLEPVMPVLQPWIERWGY